MGWNHQLQIVSHIHFIPEVFLGPRFLAAVALSEVVIWPDFFKVRLAIEVIRSQYARKGQTKL